MSEEKKSSKLKLFIENFLVYGLGGIIKRIIPFLMIPVITRLMPSSDYYGISDLSDTVIQFGSAFAIMGMYDAMFRLFFEKEDEEYKKEVCSTAIIYTIFTSILVFLILIVFKDYIAKYFFGDKKYAFIVYFSAAATLVTATNSIVSAPTRMQNKRKVFLVTNLVGPLLSYSISIPLLLKGHYLIALPLAAVLSGMIMETSFGIMNRKWFTIKKFNKKMLKPLLSIAIPLLPTFIIYWVFNSCDKLMITNMIDVGAAGVYSVGSKLGHASHLIYSAFAGGWQYFAFSTMKEKNQVESNSKIFEYLAIISYVATSFVCAWSYLIFKMLFTEEYLSGYIIAPYLFLAPLLLMIYQVISNQFLVVKKTLPTMIILSFGALINVMINLLLIPLIGIEGASIATLMGYIVSVVICAIVLCRMKLMVISFRYIFSTLVMVVFMVSWRFCFSQNIYIGTIVALLTSIVIIFPYRNEIKYLLRKVNSGRNRK